MYVYGTCVIFSWMTIPQEGIISKNLSHVHAYDEFSKNLQSILLKCVQRNFTIDIWEYPLCIIITLFSLHTHVHVH